jgi:hypothetical protein
MLYYHFAGGGSEDDKSMDPKAKSPTDDSDQFLLAEHRHFTESLWKNEEVGEKRLNVFITLVTAVITALVALHAKENVLLGESRFLVTSYAMLALLAFGFVTLQRMRRRSWAAEEYRTALKLLREKMTELGKLPAGYQPFASAVRSRRGSGGLGEMVALINTIILAALMAFVHLHYFHSRRGLWVFLVYGAVCNVYWKFQVNYFHRLAQEQTDGH